MQLPVRLEDFAAAEHCMTGEEKRKEKNCVPKACHTYVGLVHPSKHTVQCGLNGIDIAIHKQPEVNLGSCCK